MTTTTTYEENVDRITAAIMVRNPSAGATSALRQFARWFAAADAALDTQPAAAPYRCGSDDGEGCPDVAAADLREVTRVTPGAPYSERDAEMLCAVSWAEGHRAWVEQGVAARNPYAAGGLPETLSAVRAQLAAVEERERGQYAEAEELRAELARARVEQRQLTENVADLLQHAIDANSAALAQAVALTSQGGVS